MDKLLITTHYADGTPSETREMTEAEQEQYLKDCANAPTLPTADTAGD